MHRRRNKVVRTLKGDVIAPVKVVSIVEVELLDWNKCARFPINLK